MSITFKNNLAPIEVFFKNKYKHYYARGKLNLLFTRVFANPKDSNKYQSIYLLGVYALVNNEYLKYAAHSDPEDKSFLMHFIGSNRRKYDKTISNVFRDLLTAKTPMLSAIGAIDINSFKPSRFSNKQVLSKSNKSLILSDIKISKDNTIDDKIVKNQPIIPYGIFIDTLRIIDRETKKEARPFDQKSFHIFACNISEPLKHYPDGRYRIFSDWLSYFYDQLSGVFGYPKITKIDFIKLVKQVADLGYDWITTKTAAKSNITRLNQFLESIKETDCYLTNFCYDIFYDLIEDMLTAEVVTECEYCELLFPFEKGKKYCSLKNENRNCGKKARNNKFYKKHRKRILTRQRVETRLTRNLYKTKGITK